MEFGNLLCKFTFLHMFMISECNALEFDEKCLHSVDGQFIRWNTSKRLSLDFFIPPNWMDSREEMRLLSDPINITLFPPSLAPIEDNKSNCLERFSSEFVNIGWNKVYLRFHKESNRYTVTDQVGRVWYSNNGSTVETMFDITVKGLNSFLNCDGDERIYVVRAKNCSIIPVVLVNNVTWLTLYSKGKKFKASIALGNREFDVCLATSGGTFMKPECISQHKFYTTLSCNTDYYVLVHLNYFESHLDYFNLGDFSFADVTVCTDYVSDFIVKVKIHTAHAFYKNYFGHIHYSMETRADSPSFKASFIVVLVLLLVILILGISLTIAFKMRRRKKKLRRIEQLDNKVQIKYLNHPPDDLTEDYEIQNSLYKDFNMRLQKASVPQVYATAKPEEENYEDIYETDYYEIPNDLYLPIEARTN